MKKWLLLVVLALAGVLAWYFGVTRKKPKEEVAITQPVAVSRYSAAFTNSVGSFLNSYYALSDAFVNWDSMGVIKNATALDSSLAGIQWSEIKEDTVISQTANSYINVFETTIPELTGSANLTAKRRTFHSLSQNLYDLLRTIRYDGEKMYLQQCPMAFNDTEEGIWLSKEKKIRNPYLGLHHPKYKSGMLSCGETKDTLNFAAVQ